MPDDTPVGPGVVIGNGYKLDRLLGESSLGDIYLATQESTGQQVAVEVLSGELRRDEERVNRLLQEIELVAALQHPNIIQAIEAGQDSETYFLVTAYEDGRSLEELLREGAIEETAALATAIGIARALKYAWDEKRILHRDVKPSNIFVPDAGESKLTGFGIAKSSESQSLGLTGAGFTIGTPEYMSPEQIRASDTLDYHSDMYALGIVLYEMVTGHLPFEEKAPILLMQKHMDEMPDPANERNPAVSRQTSDVIQTMLAKEPNARFATWQDTIDAMQLASDNVGSEPVEPAPRAVPVAAPAAANVSHAAASGQATGQAAAPAGEKKKRFGCVGILAFGLGIGTAALTWMLY